MKKDDRQPAGLQMDELRGVFRGMLAIRGDAPVKDQAVACLSYLMDTRPPKEDMVQDSNLSLARQCIMNIKALGYGGYSLSLALQGIEKRVSSTCDPQCIKAMRKEPVSDIQGILDRKLTGEEPGLVNLHLGYNCLQMRDARSFLFRMVNDQVHDHFGQELATRKVVVDSEGGIHHVPGPVQEMAVSIIQELKDNPVCAPLVEGSIKNVPLLLQWHLGWCGAPPLSDTEASALEEWLGTKLEYIRRG